MSLIKSLKIARNEAKVSNQFPVTHLNAADIFETKEGVIGAVLGFNGVAFAIEEPSQLNVLSSALHHALSALDERLICYMTMHRKKENIDLDGEFSSTFAKKLNDKYHARFKNRALYKNNLYLTVMLKGDTSTTTAKCIHWIKRMLDAGSSALNALHREENSLLLNQIIEQLQANLSQFKPRRLGSHDAKLGYSELITFLSLIPNVGDTLPFKTSQNLSVISKNIPLTFVDCAQYPEGHIGHYVTRKQILFGDYIQFQGAVPDDKQFGAMLSLKKYGQETGSLMLEPLLNLDAEFIATHSFAPISRDAALHTISLKRSKLISAEDLGVSQIEQLEELEDAIASEKALLGHHHNTLLLLAPSIKQLNININQAVKAYGQSGTVVIKESLGMEAAFWAQIPGNHAYIARASLITSQNFIDFCPLHNLQAGFRDNNHLRSAVTLLETPSKTPVFFNYHVKGSATNPAKGHALVFGSNNSGKTTLIAFMDAQLGRYHGRSFFLDRDCASKIYILASGNSSYTVINPGNKNNIRMNPLQLPDTEENRTFVKNWFAQLIKQPHEEELPSDIAEKVNECINYSFEHLDKPYRRLSFLVGFFSNDFSRWPELKRWLKGSDTRESGEYHWLFDNAEDALSFDFNKVGFDITYLIDNVTPIISTPVYLYLVYRMQQCLDGRLTTINIDEAFQVFQTPFWVKLLSSWVPTIRKKNGHFVFATQSPESIINSPISPVILANVATTIIFPNTNATKETYINHLKLTDAQYQTVINNTPASRLFLYKQDNEAILCKLDLSELAEDIRVLSGNEKSVRLLDEILQTTSDNPDEWLPIFIQKSASQ